MDFLKVFFLVVILCLFVTGCWEIQAGEEIGEIAVMADKDIKMLEKDKISKEQGKFKRYVNEKK